MDAGHALVSWRVGLYSRGLSPVRMGLFMGATDLGQEALGPI